MEFETQEVCVREKNSWKEWT